MSNFCTRCGAQLGEDGVCPNCGMTYGVPDAYEEPQTYANTYSENDAETEYAQEVPNNQGYADGGYSYMPQTAETQPFPDYGSSGYAGSGTDNYAAGGSGYAGSSYSSAAYTQPTPAANRPARPRGRASSPAENFKDWVGCMREFFRKDPFAAVNRVLDGGMHLWTFFAGLNVVCGAFCIAGMFGNGFRWIVDKVFGSYAMLINFYKEYTFGNLFVLFLFSLVMLVLLFAVVTGCEYLLFSMSGKKPHIEKLAKIIAISFFPMTIACAGAYILSFFLMRLAGMVIFAGAIASFRLLNETVKREAGELPFWNVTLCNAAQMVASVLIISIALAVI